MIFAAPCGLDFLSKFFCGEDGAERSLAPVSDAFGASRFQRVAAIAGMWQVMRSRQLSMRALIVDADGGLYPQGCGRKREALGRLNYLRQTLESAPSDIGVAVLVDDPELPELVSAMAPQRLTLLRGERETAISAYLADSRADDYLILSSSELGKLSSHQLLLDPRTGLSDDVVRDHICSWLSCDGLAGDSGAALGAIRRELVRIVDGTGMPIEGWIEHWLDTEHPALAGAKPSEFMDTFPRRLVVKKLLGAMASGAYM
ncbi:MbcA/ParS/Xre antitoxin family protein [Kinneretia aquatilis]|uniref:MbcA/ParS/Xre antitoxin family protein n=1 Tax=Kinneretia aquatilis TaxID=2070761 RepID=UPI0014950D97|nr:MbcA/ParS/Xre antitoxin family protein [Paucibacter aquatile]WIV99678.1 MbcA/ParS/Xre antitoxin family protein [Paucibacter aquatile]